MDSASMSNAKRDPIGTAASLLFGRRYLKLQFQYYFYWH